MTLHEADNKKVRITLKNGKIYIGIAYDYTSDFDNEPDPESITIDNIELFVDEIESIELLSDR